MWSSPPKMLVTVPVFCHLSRQVFRSLGPLGYQSKDLKVTSFNQTRKGHVSAQEKTHPREIPKLDVQVVDLRSDTITKPTPGMRKAMAEAEVGDDVYREDPTVKELQKRCANMFGMEATLFVPSGTMGNLISLMVHCQERGSEVLLGNNTHLFLKEQGGMAQFGGICPRTLRNLPDGTFDLDELCSCIRTSNDPNQTKTKVICLENSHNFCGGRALPLHFVEKVYEIAKEHDLIVHTDGARILNSATALGVPVSEILQYSDTVNLCFSKGLSAPVGSIIGGNAEFIENFIKIGPLVQEEKMFKEIVEDARLMMDAGHCMITKAHLKHFVLRAIRMRKALGGGMRQVGILAAAALYSLDNIVPKLAEDHKKAKKLAQEMMAINNNVIDINLDGVDTNILTVKVVKPGLTAPMFCQRVREVTDEELSDPKERISVKINPMSPSMFRMLTHNDVSHEMIDLAVKKLQYVIQEYGTVQ